MSCAIGTGRRATTSTCAATAASALRQVLDAAMRAHRCSQHRNLQAASCDLARQHHVPRVVKGSLHCDGTSRFQLDESEQYFRSKRHCPPPQARPEPLGAAGAEDPAWHAVIQFTSDVRTVEALGTASQSCRELATPLLQCPSCKDGRGQRHLPCGHRVCWACCGSRRCLQNQTIC